MFPGDPPFALRASILTPLDHGGVRFESDGLIEVGADGRIASIGRYQEWAPEPEGGRWGGMVVDLRPHLLLPGMIDLHAHLPQVPNAGLGAGIGLLRWLERYIFPLERAFDEQAAGRLAPRVFRAMAGAGTTTAVIYGAIFEPSLDATFRAAEAHGIRAVIGKVMMDRLTYDDLTPKQALEISLRQSADLCERWHGRDDGRLQYAFTPRFAVACTAEMLRESAALAKQYDAYWQTHISEDIDETAEVARLFPETRDYLDVYDRAGGLGPKAILAHAVHLSSREVSRVVETGTRIAHCPASNLFLGAGLMPVADYLGASVSVGLGSDVAAGPELSIFSVMRAGAYVQGALRGLGRPCRVLTPLEWLRLGTLDAARALGLERVAGSLEVGKEADLIAVDPRLSDPLPGPDVGEADADDASDDAEELMSRLMFRAHPDMVRAAWVRGHLLEGPAG